VVVLKKEVMLRIQGCGAERRAIDGETCVLYCRNELLVRGRDMKNGTKVTRQNRNVFGKG
jgi:hypothetical protein